MLEAVFRIEHPFQWECGSEGVPKDQPLQNTLKEKQGYWYTMFCTNTVGKITGKEAAALKPKLKTCLWQWPFYFKLPLPFLFLSDWLLLGKVQKERYKGYLEHSCSMGPKGDSGIKKSVLHFLQAGANRTCGQGIWVQELRSSADKSVKWQSGYQWSWPKTLNQQAWILSFLY